MRCERTAATLFATVSAGVPDSFGLSLVLARYVYDSLGIYRLAILM